MEMEMEMNHHNHNPKPLLPISFSNGTIMSKSDHQLYRECLKNHAASLGGHALDGCMEFMPSPNSTPTRPSSITCAACGCHRNFHRRLPSSHHHHHHHHHQPQRTQDEEVKTPEEEEDHVGSGPHMLMALSAGGRTNMNMNMNTKMDFSSPATGMGLPRKRFRTKFSKEQKERMLVAAERMGWRMLKRDEGLAEEWCREIGVSKSVFKVWMHNNKSGFKHAAAAADINKGVYVVGINGGRDGQVVNGSCSDPSY